MININYTHTGAQGGGYTPLWADFTPPSPSEAYPPTPKKIGAAGAKKMHFEAKDCKKRRENRTKNEFWSISSAFFAIKKQFRVGFWFFFQTFL